MLESDEIRTRLIIKFKVEIARYLERLRDNLPKLELAPEDEEALKQVFMLTHTIKGNLGMMLLLDDGFARLNPYAQKLEMAAQSLRDGSVRLERALLNEFYENIELIEHNFTQVA